MKRSGVVLEATLILSFCGFVLVPVLHELGHYVVGVLTGCEVNYVRFLPPNPHVSFRSASADAIPWVNAGGLALPSVVATCFAVAWFLMRKGANRHVRLFLWLSSIVLFSGNLGLFIEAGREKNMSSHHLLFLGEHFGFRGGALVAFQIVPAIVSLGIIVFLVITGSRRASSQQP